MAEQQVEMWWIAVRRQKFFSFFVCVCVSVRSLCSSKSQKCRPNKLGCQTLCEVCVREREWEWDAPIWAMNMGAGLCLTSSRTLHQTPESSREREAHTLLYLSAWFREKSTGLLYDAFLRERGAKSNIHTYMRDRLQRTWTCWHFLYSRKQEEAYHGNALLSLAFIDMLLADWLDHTSAHASPESYSDNAPFIEIRLKSIRTY